MYRILDPEETVKTIETLKCRIQERFPGAGLARVCAELEEIARTAQERTVWVSRPNIALRCVVGAVIIFVVVALIYSLGLLGLKITELGPADLVQVFDAVFNDIIVIGAAMVFLVSVETRIKRSRSLAELHQLRSIAHVIDMHQLTKDPGRFGTVIPNTASSPKRVLSRVELSRYLDYCSEMLSLTGKIAAVYAQNHNDPVVLSAVNDVETLTTSLSSKIWQKIVILHANDG